MLWIGPWTRPSRTPTVAVVNRLARYAYQITLYDPVFLTDASYQDLEQAADALIEDMRQRMVKAAANDNEARKQGRIASQKLLLLPQVTGLLGRTALQNAIADPDSGFVEAMKFMLEPLSDGSLPAHNIQRDLFNALTNMHLSQDTLIQSGIGKVAIFYTKSKRPHYSIKRTAERLLGEWTRPFLNRTDDYRKRKLQTADYDPKYDDLHRDGRLGTYLANMNGDSIRPTVDAAQLVSQAMADVREAARNPMRNPNRAVRQFGQQHYDIVPNNIRARQTQDPKYIKRIGTSSEAWLRRIKAKQAERMAGRA